MSADPHVGLLADHPVLAEKWGVLAEAVWNRGVIDPGVLELCRLRIAQLHGVGWARVHRTPAALAAGLDDDMAQSLSAWPTDPRFEGLPRAALELTELFVVDAHSVSDEQVARVRDRVGDEGVVQLTMALAVWDGIYRVARTLPSSVG